MKHVGVRGGRRRRGGGGSLVSGEDHLGEPDEGVPLCRRPQQADLPDGFLAVALGQEVGLLHAVALERRQRTRRCVQNSGKRAHVTNSEGFIPVSPADLGRLLGRT